MELELLHEGREVVFRESPRERGYDGLVIALEPQQPRLDVGERAEIVRCQRLALKDREVDLAWLANWREKTRRASRYEDWVMTWVTKR